MRSEWRTATLGELVRFSSGGTPSKKVREYWNGNIPWISAKAMKSERISTSELMITEEGLAAGSKMAPVDSLLLLTRGSGLFNGIPICIVERPVAFNQDVKCIESCSDVSSHFIFYWLKANESYLKAKLEVTGIGAGKFDTKFLQELQLELPPEMERQQIVAIANAISEKIETNQKINDNLQQQLFSLYENMTRTSPCSKEYTLSNLCDFQEGYVNPAQTHPEYFDGEVKWLRAVDINESFITDTSRTLTKAGFESAKKSALLFKPNTIVISKSGTIGRLGIIADYMCGNRAVINIAPHDTNMLAFIYCFLKSKQREFPNMAVGSVQKNLYVSLLEPLSVSIPDDESLIAFNAAGASILDMIHNNCVENTNLANLRDTILPKLMSGEIDVSNIEI